MPPQSLAKIGSLGWLTRAARREAMLRSTALRMERALARAARRRRPVLVGPWLSEIGFETLYWIPLLNRLVSRYGIEREQVTALSRGGAEPWYRHLCARYMDAFDFVSEAEVKGWHRRAAAGDGLKQLALTPLERELLQRAREALGADPVVVHPLVMYGRFRYFWAGEQPLSAVRERCDYRLLARGEEPLEGLPRDYVALKPYFSLCFPDSAENRAFVLELVEALLRFTNVVLLTTGLDLDDHGELDIAGAGSLYSLEHLMTPRDNLAVQTRVINGAKALFTTYGGFSYLGPFLGVPSFSFYSAANFNPAHLEAMRAALRELDGAGFVTLDRRDFPLSDTALRSLGSLQTQP